MWICLGKKGITQQVVALYKCKYHLNGSYAVTSYKWLFMLQLTKQTTVQATGVASNLLEAIQGAGFKLQALNLSFEDEEDAVS